VIVTTDGRESLTPRRVSRANASSVASGRAESEKPRLSSVDTLDLTDIRWGRDMADSTKTKAAPAFSAEERAAMKDRADEVKASKRGASKADGEADLLAKVAAMPDDDRVMAERIHAVITAAAPTLEPKTWYGMPAYAKDGKVLVFFQPASKFKARYSTLGFNDVATLDDGAMWPTAFALTSLDSGIEKRIAALVAQAAG
jgi:uncharacterized protein YdhG (YjbR/CyaY superfamily)